MNIVTLGRAYIPLRKDILVSFTLSSYSLEDLLNKIREAHAQPSMPLDASEKS